MTIIENDSPKVIYQGPFQKGQLLPLTFPYIIKTDVQMMIDSTPAEINKDFEIITEVSAEHPVAYPNSVYLKNALPNAKQITLYRVTPLDQQAAFPQNSKFRSEHIERALDKLTMQQQEQEEQLARCVIAPITLKTFNGQLPVPEADQALKWNTDGTELENYDIIGEQEAFENDVNTRFEEQSTAFENRITEFEENTNTQFSEFRAEINENLEIVLDAAAKLENLDSSVQAAENAASQANAAAARADEAVVAADQAVDEAESAADQAEDALTEVKEFIQNAEHEISQYYSLPMFTPIWSDHILNDASYLRADTFSWHNGDIYTTAYNLLLNEFNSDKSIEESEGNVTYKRTPSGFKIAAANQHDKVLNTFTSTGKSWFYVIDTEQQRFKLPRTQYSFTGIRDTVGGDVEAGLPGISHTHSFSGTTSSNGKHKHRPITDSLNVFSGLGGGGGGRGWYQSGDQGYTSEDGAHTHTFSGTTGSNSAVNSIFGKSNTVQPPATQMYLYFFVGNYARPQSDIDIGELVELVNERDFEGQVADGKQELTTTKNNCIKEINSTSVGGRVLKTGDVMTGNLTIEKSANSDLYLDNTSIDYTSTTVPSNAIRVGGIFARDKNNKITGCFQSYLDTNGNYIAGIYSRRSVEGADKNCVINTCVGPTGNIWTAAPTPATGDNSTKIATTAYCVNMRCTTKATTTSSASTTRPCWVIQNYLSGGSWYRVWSDGWIEQGGISSAVADKAGITVSFLKSFANTNYDLQVTSIWQGTNDDTTWMNTYQIRQDSLQNNSFYVYSRSSTQKVFRWYACGY